MSGGSTRVVAVNNARPLWVRGVGYPLAQEANESLGTLLKSGRLHSAPTMIHWPVVWQSKVSIGRRKARILAT